MLNFRKSEKSKLEVQLWSKLNFRKSEKFKVRGSAFVKAQLQDFMFDQILSLTKQKAEQHDFFEIWGIGVYFTINY